MRACCRRLGLLQLAQDAPAVGKEARAGLGQPHAARGPVQQPGADPALQRGDGAGDRRRRQAQLPRARREALLSATATKARIASRRSMDYSLQCNNLLPMRQFHSIRATPISWRS